MSKPRRRESTSEEWRLRALRRIVALFAALVVSLTLTAAASANVSFTKAYGWGVSDGASRFETCTSSCRGGIGGGGAGQLDVPDGVATDSSGDVYVDDADNARIDEFSAAGAFIKAYGWGVSDGASQSETCTTTCRAGIYGGGAGQLGQYSGGVATDSSGDVYVADYGNNRIDEFSAGGVFIKAYGWGVVDGASKFETCTSTCRFGLQSRGAGGFYGPTGVATNPSGDVYVADEINVRIDEFSAGGVFIKAYGWGVVDGASQFETCTSTCRAGISGGGAGQLYNHISVATDPSGDVYVADEANIRIDEFSPAGAFIKAYGWGVVDGASQFETCTSTCRAGISGGGAGQLYAPTGVATDPSGDVYVTDYGNARIDEFSPAGAFIKAFGWGVVDGAGRFETCTSTCQQGIDGEHAGQLYGPLDVATDPSGDVYVGDGGQGRIDEFGGSVAASPCGKLTPAGPPSTPDYCVPLDWRAHQASKTPGVEPLNVIISGRSTVSLGAIYAGLTGGADSDWDQATPCEVAGVGVYRTVSPETADVAGDGLVRQQEAWRRGGCLNGWGRLSVNGNEDHIRFWRQPIPGTKTEAWFGTASYETACVVIGEPPDQQYLRWNDQTGLFLARHVGDWWHCIDGGPGSYGNAGYDRGANQFLLDIKNKKIANHWDVEIRFDHRQAGIGLDGVRYSNIVDVVTITKAKP